MGHRDSHDPRGGRTFTELVATEIRPDALTPHEPFRPSATSKRDRATTFPLAARKDDFVPAGRCLDPSEMAEGP